MNIGDKGVNVDKAMHKGNLCTFNNTCLIGLTCLSANAMSCYDKHALRADAPIVPRMFSFATVL